MRVRRAVLILVAVTLLAGWSATAPPGTNAVERSADADRSEGAISAEVVEGAADADESASAALAQETTTAGDAEDDLPPGVNETGLEDPAELVDAHQAALNESGFAFEFRANVTVGPASQRTVQCGTVEAGLSPLVVESTSERDLGEGPTVVGTDFWADDDAVAVRYDRDGRTTVREYNRSEGEFGVPDETWAHLPRADLESQVTNAWLLELALEAGEFELAEVEDRNGERVAVLRATEAAAATNLTDLDATVVVDMDGRVHDVSLTAAYEGEEADTSIEYDFELTEVGSVTVERPEWVGQVVPAENETTTGDAEELNAEAEAESGVGTGAGMPAPVPS